ncbi:peroxidase-like [Pyrus ussuriensis x Pyrus communis]|uniref:peroxidase n=1 Tax=Pyrus ussuriensis x Pyrus communis TaxID=2448454 RepID=A0A5N5G989_9ROSA|nr:peroxidase-like [Pyrus ussuriensis x Pyrus communis]
MTVLSGGHTLGRSQCSHSEPAYTTKPTSTPALPLLVRILVPLQVAIQILLLSIDIAPNRFDNEYYKALVARRGLLHSDQELFNGECQDALVRTYS